MFVETHSFLIRIAEDLLINLKSAELLGATF